ncbi:MAG: ABC transporter ATP-binding protein [Balneolales bacterium]|nr:ABC transporter ATP-binding protein [Balneolales bacterium]
MVLIQANGLTKTYTGKAEAATVDVLKGVNVSFEAGTTNAIIGSSGSGKSTLLHILGGLDKPTQGQVLFKGTNIAEYTDTEITRFRNREIGFVFQFHHLLPEFTALENVMMPALAQNRAIQEIKPRAKEILAKFGLEDRFEHRPGMLSGGEQQRVAMARALINKPSLLLADEPTGNLDEQNTAQLMDLILGLNTDSELTIIMVTHDKALAQRCDATYEIKNGVI